jgi:MFS transporter, DHA1 family, inner membrane transport protein
MIGRKGSARIGLWCGLDPKGLGALSLAALGGVYSSMILNLLPSFINTWVVHLGVPERVAGDIATVNLLAHATGVGATLYLVSRWPLPRIALVGLVLAISGDLASIFDHTLVPLLVARVLAGLGLGLQYGAVINWFGRNENSAQGFGLFITLQFVLAALLFAIIPHMFTLFGDASPYLALLPLMIMAVVCLPVLGLNGGSQPLRVGARPIIAANMSSRASLQQAGIHKVLSVLAFAAFNLAALGLYGYMQRYGEAVGLSAAAASGALALSAVCGIPGGFLVVALGSRYGRLWPLLISLLAFAAPIVVFARGTVSAVVFVLGQAIIGLAWTVVFPYFLDVQSALDKTGRLSVVGMLAAAIAAACGPSYIGLGIDQGTYGGAFRLGLWAFAASAVMAVAPARLADLNVTSHRNASS